MSKMTKELMQETKDRLYLEAGRQQLEQLQNQRQTIANDLKEFRKKCREKQWAKDIVDAARKHWLQYARNHKPDVRPTVEAMTEYAMSLLSYSKTPGQPIGDEYYSCCGAEDGIYENKQDAKKYAGELLAAAEYMIRETWPPEKAGKRREAFNKIVGKK